MQSLLTLTKIQKISSRTAQCKTQVAFQLIYLLQDIRSTRSSEAIITPIFAIGMAIGVFIQQYIFRKWIPLKDQTVILMGVGISILALFPEITGSFLGSSSKWMEVVKFFCVSLGSGLYLPRVFALYCSRFKVHEQGILLGILLGIMVAGELIADILLTLLEAIPISWEDDLVSWLSILMLAGSFYFFRKESEKLD